MLKNVDPLSQNLVNTSTNTEPPKQKNVKNVLEKLNPMTTLKVILPNFTQPHVNHVKEEKCLSTKMKKVLEHVENVLLEL